VSQSPGQGHILEFWPSRSSFPSPSPGRLPLPRARHYRRYLEGVLLDHRFGCGPVTHLVCSCRSPGLAGGWIRWTDRVERVLFAGSARAWARDITRAATRPTGPSRAPTGPARSLRPPTVLPCACPRRTRSLGCVRDASACNQLGSDCKRRPLGGQGLILANPPCCVPRWPGCCCAARWLPRIA
jgi:hypothetical protein